ncbi:hypothetical protein M8818_002662 [Zalaria obscura]|uniref:Uncharacterized protein n=1 Tax=Zalaria obscura TaxID=2024903 RepID=A0ACC3SGI8_9PEZI
MLDTATMPLLSSAAPFTASKAQSDVDPAIEYARQSERLAQYTAEQEDDTTGSTRAVEAKFVTPQDPVIQTVNGGRLPAVPLEEAIKLNVLKDVLEDRDPSQSFPAKCGTREAKDGTIHGARPSDVASSKQSSSPGAPLRQAIPQSRTNPLFPPLPMYGPPTLLRSAQCWFFRFTNAFLSLGFLLVIVLGAAFTSIPMMLEHIRIRLTFNDPDNRRPFYHEEKKRRKARRQAEKEWEKKHDGKPKITTPDVERDEKITRDEEFVPTEGGPDPLVCDVGYYARRVGLDVEYFDVETEDGFIIELWHLYNPREYTRLPSGSRHSHGPGIFHTKSSDPAFGEAESAYEDGNKKYPVLMIHGLLQSAGAYCCTDEDSLAFYLAKSGYDVWLGNNRCGFNPRHTMLEYSDPRMWAWNIRQMGVMDLPALTSRVLAETGFPKLGLVAHSQGTTQTFVALAKEQRPDIGEKISVFCALAPAAYAGPLIGKAYFKFMRAISPAMFRCVFGIHAFIPFMMKMHTLLPAGFYGAMGYRVFSFLFNWTDARWELDLRDRMFQFAPVYVSAESMRWWLGRECFARQKCILATRDESKMEDEEDEEEDGFIKRYYEGEHTSSESRNPRDEANEGAGAPKVSGSPEREKDKGRFAWYDDQFPPLAMWVCGADDLVDGRRLLRRFDRGREPHVNVVHKKIIEGYEHLDVIWAMDSIEKVGKEVKEVIWKTASEEARRICRTPTGCEDAVPYEEKSHHGHKQDQDGATTSDGEPSRGDEEDEEALRSPTFLDSTAGEWSDKLREDLKREGLDATPA